MSNVLSSVLLFCLCVKPAWVLHMKREQPFAQPAESTVFSLLENAVSRRLLAPLFFPRCSESMAHLFSQLPHWFLPHGFKALEYSFQLVAIWNNLRCVLKFFFFFLIVSLLKCFY